MINEGMELKHAFARLRGAFADMLPPVHFPPVHYPMGTAAEDTALGRVVTAIGRELYVQHGVKMTRVEWSSHEACIWMTMTVGWSSGIDGPTLFAVPYRLSLLALATMKLSTVDIARMLAEECERHVRDFAIVKLVELLATLGLAPWRAR